MVSFSSMSRQQSIMDSDSSDDSGASLTITTKRRRDSPKPQTNNSVESSSSPNNMFKLTKLKTTPGKKRKPQRQQSSPGKRLTTRNKKRKSNLALNASDSSDSDDSPIKLTKKIAHKRRRPAAETTYLDSSSDDDSLLLQPSNVNAVSKKPAARATAAANLESDSSSDEESPLARSRKTSPMDQKTAAHESDNGNDSDSDDTAEILAKVKRANHSRQQKKKAASPEAHDDVPQQITMNDISGKENQMNGRVDENLTPLSKGDNSGDEESSDTNNASVTLKDPPVQKQSPGVPSAAKTDPSPFQLPEQSDSSSSESDSDSDSDSEDDHVEAAESLANDAPLYTTPGAKHPLPEGAPTNALQQPIQKQSAAVERTSARPDDRMTGNELSTAFWDEGVNEASMKDAHTTSEVIDLSYDDPGPRNGSTFPRELSGRPSPLAKSPAYNIASRSFLNKANDRQNQRRRSTAEPIDNWPATEDDSFQRQQRRRRVTDEHSRHVGRNSYQHEDEESQGAQQSLLGMPRPWVGKPSRRVRDPTASNFALAASITRSKRTRQDVNRRDTETAGYAQAGDAEISRDGDIRRFMQRPQLVNGNAQQIREGIRSTRFDINPPAAVWNPVQDRQTQEADDDIIEILEENVEPAASLPRTRSNRSTSSTGRTKRKRSSSSSTTRKSGRKQSRKGRGRGRGRGRKNNGGAWSGGRGRGKKNNDGAWGDGGGAWNPSPQFQRQEDPAFDGFGAEITF